MRRRISLATLLATLLFAALLSVASAQGAPPSCEGKNKKKCEVPEVPWALALPATGVVLAAGYYLVERRRGSLSAL